MPRKRDRSELTEPVERVYDVQKTFRISRHMDDAIKNSVREYRYTSEAEWLKRR